MKDNTVCLTLTAAFYSRSALIFLPVVDSKIALLTVFGARG
jgi:hypothetical protein